MQSYAPRMPRRPPSLSLRRSTWILSLALLLPLGSRAETEETNRKIFATLGTIVPSEYVLQGLVFETKGVIAQPYGRITLRPVESLDLFGGFYLSLHDAHTDAGFVNPPGTPKRLRAFYEADWFGGVTLRHGPWSLTTTYWESLSPSDAFDTARAVELLLAFADKGRLAEHFAFDPYVNVYIETDGKSGTGIDEGTYLQIGWKPNYGTAAFGHPLIVALPAAVGLGFDDFYAQDERYGYASIGLAITAPFAPLLPEDYGAWSLTPSLTYFNLNEDVQYKAADADRFVASLAINVDF